MGCDLLSEMVVKSYRATDPENPVTFARGDLAHAEPALPGWRIRVDELFNELAFRSRDLPRLAPASSHDVWPPLRIKVWDANRGNLQVGQAIHALPGQRLAAS